MTLCASKASGPRRGKPVLICILACSLGFHAITSECGTSTKIRHFKNEASVALNRLVSLFYLFVARGGRKRGNRRTDRRTDQVLYTARPGQSFVKNTARSATSGATDTNFFAGLVFASLGSCFSRL